MTEETKMPEQAQMPEGKISWDEALTSANYVKLETDVPKRLILTNYKLQKRSDDSKIDPGEVEFVADVVEEDGEPVKDKKFVTTSKRLKTKLRPIFEKKATTDKVALSIIRVGEQFNTQYSVIENK